MISFMKLGLPLESLMLQFNLQLYSAPKYFLLLSHVYQKLYTGILKRAKSSGREFYRKPRWVPVDESSMYTVTSRKRLPPNEEKETRRLYNNHRCYMRLVYEHCRNENLRLSDTGEIIESLLEREAKEHKMLMEFNTKENERMAILREQRIEEEKEKLIEEILEFKEREAEIEHRTRTEALQQLDETQKLVLTFIDPNHLEEAIEQAIDNPVDPNFSIDLEGRIYPGRKTVPHLTVKDSLKIMEIKDDGYSKKSRL